MQVTSASLSSFFAFRPIQITDKAVLQACVQRFRPGSKNYEDSWGYVIQATRYGGFRWHNPQTGSLIFFGRKSATDPTLVVPLFFATPAYLASVIDRVQHRLKAPKTLVKNVNPEDVKDFLPYGFRQYQKHERWSAEARFDDQTYPQQLVDLKTLREPKGKKYHQLRRMLNKSADVTLRPYHETDREAVLEIFALRDGQSKSSPQKERGKYFASHAMYPTAAIDRFVIIDRETDKVIGFTATSDISSRTTALVASIFAPGIKVASVWGIYQTLMTKYHDGFQVANLGGCEIEGTYIFLQRTFRPVEELEKTHLVYS